MEGTIGEVRLFAGNFAPRNWAFCQGQLLNIADNQALFSIIGTIYGGDGRTTFGLPDLRGRAPISPGQGPGLSNYTVGQRGGAEAVTLSTNQIPAHSHSVAHNLSAAAPATTKPALDTEPSPTVAPAVTTEASYASPTDTTMLPGAVTGSITAANTGGNQAHENRSPWLAMNYIICLIGVFPSRS